MTAAIVTASLLVLQLSPHHYPVNIKYKKFLIREVHFLWGMDENVSTFAAQIRQESDWNPDARSPHAAGLTQFTPNSARWISTVYPELSDGFFAGPDRRLDWKWSIRAMVRYDRYLYTKLTRFTQDSNLWTLTLRSYNGGLGWIKKEHRNCKTMDFACCRRYRRRSACRENIAYSKAVLERWKVLYEAWDR